MRPFNEPTRQTIAGRCAAFARLEPRELTGLKRAAVAIALVGTGDSSGGTALLLTLRASGLRAHSNQWALPGGRCDAGETPVAAALRELHEELGLELKPNDVLGMLDDYPTRSGYLITPIVVWAADSAKPGRGCFCAPHRAHCHRTPGRIRLRQHSAERPPRDPLSPRRPVHSCA